MPSGAGGAGVGCTVGGQSLPLCFFFGGGGEGVSCLLGQRRLARAVWVQLWSGGLERRIVAVYRCNLSFGLVDVGVVDFVVMD